MAQSFVLGSLTVVPFGPRSYHAGRWSTELTTHPLSSVNGPSTSAPPLWLCPPLPPIRAGLKSFLLNSRSVQSQLRISSRQLKDRSLEKIRDVLGQADGRIDGLERSLELQKELSMPGQEPSNKKMSPGAHRTPKNHTQGYHAPDPNSPNHSSSPPDGGVSTCDVSPPRPYAAQKTRHKRK
jgi:hypothetical protein